MRNTEFRLRRKQSQQYLKEFVKMGKVVHRAIAYHVGTTINVPSPDADMQSHLYSVKGSDKGGSQELHLTHMDLTVGTRVRITENILVEAGLFNGAMETIKGFVYNKSQPPLVTKSFIFLMVLYSYVLQ